MAVDARTLVKNFAGFSVAPVVAAIVSFVVVPIVTNVFPEDEYGKINLFCSTGTLVMGFCLLGLDNSLARYYLEPPAGVRKEGIQWLALVCGSVVCCVSCAVVCAVPVLREKVCTLIFGERDVGLIVCLAVFVFALVVMRLVNIDARMREDYRSYNTQYILQTVFTKVSFVVVALAWSTDHECSIAMMTACMVVLAAFHLLRRRRAFSPSGTTFTRRSLWTLVSFGVPYMMTSLVVNLNATIGKFALSSAGLFDEAGVFAIAVTLANAFTVFSQAFCIYWSPFMYKNYRTNQHAIIQMHDLVMFGTLVIVVLFVCFQDVLFVIVGGSYSRCQPYFMLVMLSPIQGLVCETTSYGIPIKARPIYNVVASVAGLAVSAAVSFTLVEPLGAFGAAIGVAASSVVICLIRSAIGQVLYKSVDSPLRSLASGGVIVGMCAANVVLFAMPLARMAVCAVVLAAAAVAYRRQIAKAVRALARRR